MTTSETEDNKDATQIAEGRYRFKVDESKCIGCSVCVESCPNDVLDTKDGQPYAVHPEACEGCEVCVALCEQEAIEIEELE